MASVNRKAIREEDFEIAAINGITSRMTDTRDNTDGRGSTAGDRDVPSSRCPNGRRFLRVSTRGKTRRYNSGSGSDRGRKEGEKQYSFDKATFRMAIKRTASIVKCGAAFVCREHFVLFTSRSDGDGETRRN